MNVIDRALSETAERVMSVPELEAEAKLLAERASALLPVEADARAVLRERLEAVQGNLQLARSVQGDRAKLLSKEVLEWRHSLTFKGVPVPKLALIRVHDASTRFSVRGPFAFEVTLDTKLARYYDDVRDGLRWRTRKNSEDTASLTYAYKGVIPPDARQTINEGIAAYGSSNVLLLCDAPRDAWAYRESRRSRAERFAEARALDPIIVAQVHDRLVVLGSFDPTTIEQYVAGEFVQ